MEGILVELNRNQKCGIVDTRNNVYKRLTIYFRAIPSNLKPDMTVRFEVVLSKKGNYYAKFHSIVERYDAIFNTEDREKWYLWGEDAEKSFIENIVPKIGIDIRKNPDKETCSWAIDLYDYTNNRPADLKTQNTPFFTVGKYKYKGVKCDPAYSVTFNRKDYENYLQNYPTCDIYFWIHWNHYAYEGIVVPEIYGVWRAGFAKMVESIQSSEVPLHKYTHRRTDDYNAKDSYIFNLLDSSVFEKLL